MKAYAKMSSTRRRLRAEGRAVPTDPKDSVHNVSPGEMKTRAEFSASVAKDYGAKKVILVAAAVPAFPNNVNKGSVVEAIFLGTPRFSFT